jgi:hypothetical protein
MPRRTGHREGNCKTCSHPERTRIYYLIASDTQVKPLALKFNLKPSSLYNHARKHISSEYRAAVRLGPFESEERLRQLCAENGTSVVETLRALNAGCSARWLAAFEAQADDTFISLTGQIRKNLELLARLTKELVPAPASIINTNIAIFEQPQYIEAIARLATALRPFPEARAVVISALRSFGGAGDHPLLIEAQPAEAA